MAAARYRERHAVSRKKSDHLDATVPADILRTDPGRLPNAAGRQRTRQGHSGLGPRPAGRRLGPDPSRNKLRSHLREYFPASWAPSSRYAKGSATRWPAHSLPPLPPPGRLPGSPARNCARSSGEPDASAGSRPRPTGSARSCDARRRIGCLVGDPNDLAGVVLLSDAPEGPAAPTRSAALWRCGRGRPGGRATAHRSSRSRGRRGPAGPVRPGGTRPRPRRAG